jgi:O-antigen ligase
VAVAALGIGQYLVGGVVSAGAIGRVAGPYYSPTHLALYLERVWPLALAVALYGGLQRGRRHWRWLAWGSVLVLTAGLYLTYSRAAWLLALPAALVAIGIPYRHRLHWGVAALFALSVALAATGVLLGRGASPSGLLDEIRLPVWQSTLALIGDHPWLGVGLDGFQYVYPRYMQAAAWSEPLLYHPHNVWLDAAARLGIPGLVLFALLVAGTVQSLLAGVRRWRSAVGGPDADLLAAVTVGALASLGAGLAHGLVDSGYFMADLAWCLALVAGLTHSRRRELKAEHHEP